jgi:hypothetical protein
MKVLVFAVLLAVVFVSAKKNKPVPSGSDPMAFSEADAALTFKGKIFLL